MYWSLILPAVPEDATLGDFQTADTDSGDGKDTSAHRLEDDTESQEAIEEHDIPQTAYGWGSYRCEACETEVERVWRQDGVYVCPACKRW